jgi:hypothetical protein
MGFSGLSASSRRLSCARVYPDVGDTDIAYARALRNDARTQKGLVHMKANIVFTLPPEAALFFSR